MAKSRYTNHPQFKKEMEHPVTLTADDLVALAAGERLKVPVTLTSAVVLEADDD